MKRDEIERWISPNVILVATTFLEGPMFFPHAVRQARLNKSKLILVHVIAPSSLKAETFEREPSPALNPAVRAAQLKLDEMVEEFQFEGVLCEPIALTGDPAKQISLLAKARAVDRVILGARSASRMACRVEGSLAEEVIATVDVPVCSIGRHAGPGPAHGGPLSRVLCATKLNSGSLQTVRFAGALAEWNHAHLSLLHVLNTEGMSEQSLPLARFAARERLCASVPPEATHRDHPSFLIREGDPASVILSEALSRSQDLVILGYHPIPMVPRLFTNRVIRRIIDESQCPVIIINSGRDVSAPEIHESISAEKTLVHE